MTGRFATKFTPEPFSGCWLWTAGVSGDGYGAIKRNGRQERAHRLAWEMLHGPIPAGLLVLHQCDVPLCVNPAHLFLGTAKDNYADSKQKGRNTSHTGENNGSAKLIAAQVRQIRSATGSQRGIATKFGISQERVWAIKRGIAWRHLSPD